MKLEKLPKETGLKAPEIAYFKNLPSKIQNKIQIKQEKIFLGLGFKSWSYALSFSLLLCATLIFNYQFWEQNINEQDVAISQKSSELLANVSQTSLDEYLLESDISTEELFTYLSQEQGGDIELNWGDEILEDLEEEELMKDMDSYLLN